MKPQEWVKWCFSHRLSYIVYLVWVLTFIPWLLINLVQCLNMGVKDAYNDWMQQFKFLRKAEKEK